MAIVTVMGGSHKPGLAAQVANRTAGPASQRARRYARRAAWAIGELSSGCLADSMAMPKILCPVAISVWRASPDSSWPRSTTSAQRLPLQRMCPLISCLLPHGHALRPRTAHGVP